MANLNLQDKKFITPENLRLIINYGLGFASRVKKLEDKEITPFEADKLYTHGEAKRTSSATPK